MIRPLKNGRVREVTGNGPRVHRAASKSQGNWLERVAGSLKDEPDFKEVLKLGQVARRSQRPSK